MQVLCDIIKRPGLQIIGIEEGEKIDTKGILNLLNDITAENFHNLKTEKDIQV
jgi:hypothetical protein